MQVSAAKVGPRHRRYRWDGHIIDCKWHAWPKEQWGVLRLSTPPLDVGSNPPLNTLVSEEGLQWPWLHCANVRRCLQDALVSGDLIRFGNVHGCSWRDTGTELIGAGHGDWEHDGMNVRVPHEIAFQLIDDLELLVGNDPSSLDRLAPVSPVVADAHARVDLRTRLWQPRTA